MTEDEKPAFCRALALLRAMYPTEYNMSELTPTAYWLACREASLPAVKEAMMASTKMDEWLRKMPPAPVLAAYASAVDRRRRLQHQAPNVPCEQPRIASAEQKKWVENVQLLAQSYMEEGTPQTSAMCRALVKMVGLGDGRESAGQPRRSLDKLRFDPSAPTEAKLRRPDYGSFPH